MRTLYGWAGFVVLLGLVAPTGGAEPARHATENVILFMTDGLRWQEVFSGAERL